MENIRKEKLFNDDLVSVITPVFNADNFIEKSLMSVFNQTYRNIEIVLVDDCSSDNSASLILNLQKQHPEIVYYCLEKNMGAGFARNKALEIAKGRYVAFLDSDDIWKPEKIKKQLDLMKSKKVSFSYTAIEMIDEFDQIIKEKRNIKETCSYNYLLRNTMIATSSVVLDRYQVGDFRMSTRRGGQDYATWLHLLRNGLIAYGLNDSLVKYRSRSNSLSSNKFKSIKQVWDIQTQNEKLNRVTAFFNVSCFCINAFKKHFL
jgi:teichuronic acid biosynthesis glycosyltransferase TuaG